MNSIENKYVKFFLIVLVIHFIAFIFQSFLGQTPYRGTFNTFEIEHNFYYLVLLMLCGWIYLHKIKYQKMLFEFTKNNIIYIVIIFVSGAIFQKFPDWDRSLGLGHRSIFTHSLFIAYLMHLFFIKKPDFYKKYLKIFNSIYLGMIVGITSHLLVDSSYMFAISPLIFLSAHKGHGWIPLINSGLEIPLFLIITLSASFYLLRILKKGILANPIEISVTDFNKIFNLTIPESYVMLFLSLSMFLNIGNISISTLDFGIWSFIFLAISLIFLLKSHYVQQKVKD